LTHFSSSAGTTTGSAERSVTTPRAAVGGGVGVGTDLDHIAAPAVESPFGPAHAAPTMAKIAIRHPARAFKGDTRLLRRLDMKAT
jgi:hypothetical protein